MKKINEEKDLEWQDIINFIVEKKKEIEIKEQKNKERKEEYEVS
jgi:hypothetical protein